jgi:hypothetical protein
MQRGFMQMVFLFVVFCSDCILEVFSAMDRSILRAGRRYCAVSNLSKFSAIREMIDPSEALVYGMSGVDEIMKGIENFHRQHHDVFWIFKSIEVVDDCPAVLIEFDRYWTVQGKICDTKEVYCSSASEIIEFNVEGLIRSIKYKSRPSEPVLFGQNYPAEKFNVLAAAEIFLADKS